LPIDEITKGAAKKKIDRPRLERDIELDCPFIADGLLIERACSREPCKQATLTETRTMLHDTLVNATDINDWSNRTTSKTELALLVRKLIQATVDDIVYLDIRTGEGTAIGGWDGVLEVAKGNEYVPEGKSVWEFGTNKAQRKKAEEDYEKRKADPGDGIDSAETTYIYVTSRRWDTGQKKRKRKASGRMSEFTRLISCRLGWRPHRPFTFG
jgi:hypothetical protein